ncbi:hypothetical protein D0B54_05185 [Solimonas sp. K1W22B-7]|uniref:hypothetical protein n=1 Tax=Solimonas sp. K1W22B-7 TaxID=2303331 RepID=UPI000E32E6BA|nr:hypothetical protein [Solimonas sp. K1W22B-7]AXQ28105.1 hypothetical protein D0B54_05185 [Solimonas sp. K1W22B-7]
MQAITFRNRKAGFLWGFAAAWLGMLLAMTWVVVRDGPPDDYSLHATLVVGALFWFAGLGLLIFVAGKPCYQLELSGDGQVRMSWRYPFRVVRKTLPAGELGPATVIEIRDSEGDPYFMARVKTPDGGVVDFAESSDRGECERACERLNAALRYFIRQ